MLTMLEVSSCFDLVVKHLNGNGIAAYPFELRIIIHNRDAFATLLAEELRTGTYRPASAPVAEVPKGSGSIRPVHLLSFKDQVAYALLGLKIIGHVANELGAASRLVDFSYWIRDPVRPSDWFLPYFKAWRSFGDSCIRELEKGASHVVETDIAGFYENIDSALLFSELKRIAVPESILSLLRVCLKAWIPTGRGLPQANLTSDLLAKLYLHSVDQQLVAERIIHRRYSDDTRLFCKSHVAAKKSLQVLIRLLREKTLTIQTAKTRFMDAKEADEHFRGITPLIERIRASFESRKVQERAVAIALSADYMSLAELIAEALEGAQVPIEVIWTAYSDFVLGKSGQDFNKTMFHYHVGQLASAKDTYAVDDCLERFVRQPQETRLMLRYFKTVGLTIEQEVNLLDFLEHDENIYDFQTFEILQYCSTASVLQVTRMQSIARRYAFGAYPLYLRSQARFLLHK
jgi:hypothetical protein